LHLGFAFVLSNAKFKGEFRQRWSRQLLALLGVRLDARLFRVRPGTLLVANHVSWLDVLALGALVPGNCAVTFIAKKEIRSWPLIGRLLEQNDALFVDRRAGRHLLRLNQEIASRLAAGGIVAVFPEATTTDGAGVLPFRPALFEPAVRGAHRVQPFALAYRDAMGGRCEEAAFIGQQSLWESLLAVASVPEIVVSVDACATIQAGGLTRREAARYAQTAVQVRLWAAFNRSRAAFQHRRMDERDAEPHCHAEVERHPGHFVLPVLPAVGDHPAARDIEQALRNA
jgi:1-acyl-sn-glycerol-3-phosphate acyltransferase